MANLSNINNKFLVTTGGNVGIGTTSPNVLLDVWGATPTIRAVGTSASNPSLTLSSVGITAWSQTVSGSDSSLSFNKDGSEKMRIDTSGNVGIGTASPTQKLHVVGNARVTGAYYDSNNSPGTANQVLVSTVTGTDWIDGSGSSIIGGPYLPLSAGSSYPLTGELHVDDRVIIENTTNLTTGVADSLLIKTLSSGTSITNGFGGGLSFYLENTVYSAVNEVAKISVIQTDVINIDNKMVFSVKDNNILAERLTLTGQEAVFTGNVGIGTTSPTAKLQLESTSAGAATVAAFLVNSSTTTNTETRLAFAAHTNSDIATNRYSYISTINTSGSNGQDMIFATNATGASAVERMRIESNGKIDISGYGTEGAYLSSKGSFRIDIDNDNDHTDRAFIISSNNASSDLVTVTEAGNVGIKTTSPNSKLTVSGPSTPSLANGENSIRIERHSSAAASPGVIGNGINFAQKWWSGSAALQVTGGIYGIKNASNGVYGGGLAFYTQPSSATDMEQRMVIDTSGNVGIGVTPESWGTGGDTRAIQISTMTSLSEAFDGTQLASNFYFDGTNDKYIQSDFATSYLQIDGSHRWRYAASGTADANITWSEAMRINSSGRVGINTTTTPLGTLNVVSNNSSIPTIVASGHSSGGSGTLQSWRYIQGSTSYKLDLAQQVSSGLVKYKFNTINDSTSYNNNLVLDRGNVGIGTSSPDVPLDVEGAIQASESGGDFIRMQTDGTNNIFDVNSGAYVFRTSGFSERMRITSAGNVGIVTTTPYSRLDVNGVITNRTASADPNFTVTANGMIVQDSGSLQFTQGFAGTSSAGDTVVFRYNATAWKSWSLDYTFASTDGLVKGTIGGYNNNNGGGTNFFLANQMVLNTPVATNSGQTVIVTFTGNFGIHMMCDMRYSQGGGDGAPRADRASLTYNS